ncbi:hypothetical protein GCM10007858_61360 [Bradyrhizobium liaoningense]|uniref:hypothetical protein n=1 Tax=Bradyrhizobium liaoningense TaxID=43992 RepID=UPI00235C54CC|nr:hypothetical protein GCM10007858_61360 [Bradyrhizobium liaoningense]
MRKVVKFLAAVAAIVVAAGVQQKAEAAFVGTPMGLRGAIQYIKFDQPTLAPMAFTMFCLKYKDECKKLDHTVGLWFIYNVAEYGGPRFSRCRGGQHTSTHFSWNVSRDSRSG